MGAAGRPRLRQQYTKAEKITALDCVVKSYYIYGQPPPLRMLAAALGDAPDVPGAQPGGQARRLRVARALASATALIERTRKYCSQPGPHGCIRWNGPVNGKRKPIVFWGRSQFNPIKILLALRGRKFGRNVKFSCEGNCVNPEHVRKLK